MNPFEVLGLPKSATLDDAKKRRDALARQYHPDRVSADQKQKANEKMARVNAAYDKIKQIFEDKSRRVPEAEGSRRHQEFRRDHPKSRRDYQEPRRDHQESRPHKPSVHFADDEEFKHAVRLFKSRLQSLQDRLDEPTCLQTCSHPTHDPRFHINPFRDAVRHLHSSLLKQDLAYIPSVPAWIANGEQVLDQLTADVQKVMDIYACGKPQGKYCRCQRQETQHMLEVSKGKIEASIRMYQTNVSSQTGLAGLESLAKLTAVARELFNHNPENAAKAANRLAPAAEVIWYRLKEMEDRVNARRTFWGYWQPDDVAELDMKISETVCDLLIANDHGADRRKRLSSQKW